MIASDIAGRAEIEMRKAKRCARAVRHELEHLSFMEELVRPRWGHEREAIFSRYRSRTYLPDADDVRLEKAERQAAALRELEDGIKAQKEEWKAERERLQSKRAKLEEQASQVREWSQRLTTLEISEEGLAPWDTEALEAYRRWGELPEATPEERVVLTGKDVEALFQERLGVSRSLYYGRFRPLLKTYLLSAATWALYTDGYYYETRPNSGKRWRRDEVEALLRYLQTGSVLVGQRAA
ncbi:MAG: hypothetical protein AAGI52_09415 [Bacteroidota bacterium]